MYSFPDQVIGELHTSRNCNMHHCDNHLHSYINTEFSIDNNTNNNNNNNNNNKTMMFYTAIINQCYYKLLYLENKMKTFTSSPKAHTLIVQYAS